MTWLAPSGSLIEESSEALTPDPGELGGARRQAGQVGCLVFGDRDVGHPVGFGFGTGFGGGIFGARSIDRDHQTRYQRHRHGDGQHPS